MSAAPAAGSDEFGWYLYGVVAAGAALDELAAVPAVDREYPVELVVEGSLSGVTSRVSTAEFDEAALPGRLGDAAWLEQKIRAHEQVLENVLSSATVLPCRFCTVYHDQADLRRFLAECESALVAALDRISDRVELGVKAFVDSERFASSAGTRSEKIRELSERVSQAEGGRAYLETRQIERLVADELERFRQEAAPQLHERLLNAADEGVLLAPQRPEVSGREEEMLLNGAYLVPDRTRFEHALADLARERRGEGIELELTGPWPPYNFVPEELGS